jgi:hypothetical protein
MRVLTSRAIAVAAAAAIALTSATLPASAGGYYYRRNNDAAAAAAAIGIFGAMAAIIAANQNRRVYNDYHPGHYHPGMGYRGSWHGSHHHYR